MTCIPIEGSSHTILHVHVHVYLLTVASIPSLAYYMSCVPIEGSFKCRQFLLKLSTFETLLLNSISYFLENSTTLSYNSSILVYSCIYIVVRLM